MVVNLFLLEVMKCLHFLLAAFRNYLTAKDLAF